MKTIQQCKDEVAKEAGYQSWANALAVSKVSRGSMMSLLDISNQAAKLYAESALRHAINKIDEVDGSEHHEVVIERIITELIK